MSDREMQLEREVIELREQMDQMRAQLDEAQETLRGIREGEVDALVISTPEGERIFTLQGAERPYRSLVEGMHEGAVTLTPDGTIRYCNRAFARMLQRPLEATLGTRQFGGLGLGLAISKALVELHGGTIAAHSEGRGKGATFTVHLPLLMDKEARPYEQEKAPAAPARASGPLRILLVEDHGDTARIMRQLLRGEGHQVKHAGDVATALALATAEPFDVLLSDLGLPDGSGHDLLRKLREKGVKLKAIALSGYGMAADVQKSREAGFDEHVTKPINFEALQQALNRVVGRPDAS